MTDLEIIILTYNSSFWLKKTLTSLHDHFLSATKYKVTVTVVDNASSDDTVSVVKRSFRWVKLIEMPDNLGYAAGNNVALAQSSARYVMLLNSDVELIEQSSFDVLLAYLDTHSQVAVITPKILLSSGEIDWACHRGEPTPWASLAYFSGLSKIFSHSSLFSKYHQTHLNLNQVHPIDACSGAAMIVRATAIKEVGLLDERFFMYAEDLDWCKRFREAGWQIIFHPQVTVTHHKYKSGLQSDTQALRRKTSEYFYDTMLSYYDKHYASKYPNWVRKLVELGIFIKKGGL